MFGLKIRRKYLLGLAGFTLWAGGAGMSTTQAQETLPPVSPVEALVEEALRRNPELRLYQSRIDAARGDLRSASTWKNPSVQIQGGYRQTDPDSGSGAEGTVVAGSISQPFEFPGKASLRKALARGDMEMAKLGLAQFRLALAGRVRQLALQTVLSRRRADLAATIREQSGELIELLKKRKLGGARPLLEMRVIEAGQIELDDMALHASLESDGAELELRSLLGRPPAEEPLQISVSSSRSGNVPEALPPLLEQVRTGNFGLKIAERQVEQARRSTSAARLDAMPDFSFGPFFSREASGEGQEWAAGAMVTTDLPVWDRNEGEVLKREAQVEEAQARYDLARLEAERATTLHWRTVRQLDHHFDHLTPETIEQMKDSAELADRQYRQGVIEVGLYLESQKSLLNTLKHYHETLVHRQNALLDLHLLTGGTLFNNNSDNQENEKETSHDNPNYP